MSEPDGLPELSGQLVGDGLDRRRSANRARPSQDDLRPDVRGVDRGGGEVDQRVQPVTGRRNHETTARDVLKPDGCVSAEAGGGDRPESIAQQPADVHGRRGSGVVEQGQVYVAVVEPALEMT